LSEVLTTPHHKNISYYEMFTQKASSLDRYFDTTQATEKGHEIWYIILRWIFIKWDEEAWTRLSWLRIGTGDGHM
jgi:hypothetical protein